MKNPDHTSPSSTQHTKLICSACGLLCDDVLFDFATGKSIKNTCAKGVRFFEQATPHHTVNHPKIRGEASHLDVAIEKAATLLRQSQRPLFSGLGTEVQGTRGLIKLAERTHATLDHMHSTANFRNTLAVQNSGWQTTTLTEVKNRADVILAIGTDLVSNHPRFLEKLVWNKATLFNKSPTEMIYLGGQHDAIPSLNDTSTTIIPAEVGHLPEIINVLNALALNKPLQTKSVAGIPIATLQTIVEKLKSAHYAVIVWSANQLNYAHAELTIQSLIQLIAKLNETTRTAGLPLNTGDGDTSVYNTCTWLSGYPNRMHFSHHGPNYNPQHFSTESLMAHCDVLLWVSTFNAHPPPKTTVPTIVLGHPNMQFAHPPEVFIPVGIPGVDHDGILFRMDSAVALPLKKQRQTTLPTLSTVVAQIEAALT